jgi:radical SAM protein with 4Fe4S-binding SPASM domain
MKTFVVVWRVAGHCNLRCPFCAYDGSRDIPRRHADAALIREFGAMLAQWSRHTNRPVLMSWLGGEPFLWPELHSLTEYLRQVHGIGISATTNGTTLARQEVRRHVMEHYSELTVSVDGFAPVHDALRGRGGLFDSIGRSLQWLAREKQASGQGPWLRANVVLMQGTISAFPGLCRELAAWGVDEITCNQLGGIDRPEFHPANRLLPAQVAQFTQSWPAMREELAFLGVKLAGSEGYLRRFAATAAGVKLPVEDCEPGGHYLFVTEDGIASPCSFTAVEYGLDLRNVTSLADLLALPQRFREMRGRARASACADCHSTQVCEKFSRRS